MENDSAVKRNGLSNQCQKHYVKRMKLVIKGYIWSDPIMEFIMHGILEKKSHSDRKPMVFKGVGVEVDCKWARGNLG
jgi:hypothetical protein